MSFPGLAPPPPFLPTPGCPSLPWEEWEQTFTVYLLASGAAELPPQRRKAILLHCLGAEGQRVYRTLPLYGSSFRRRATSSSSVIVSTAAANTQASPFMTLLLLYGSSVRIVRSLHKMMLSGTDLLLALLPTAYVNGCCSRVPPFRSIAQCESLFSLSKQLKN